MSDKSMTLYDEVVLIASITCSKCKKIGQTGGIGDDFEASDHFYTEGWRKGREWVYCPSCAKKHLKSKQLPHNQ